jgi:hypothetical protein
MPLDVKREEREPDQQIAPPLEIAIGTKAL